MTSATSPAPPQPFPTITWLSKEDLVHPLKTREVERRLAIDWGSGSLKFEIADLNTLSGQVERSYCSGFIPFRLRQDLVESGENKLLSDRIFAAALQAFQIIKNAADPYHVQSCRGIATEVFREATNGSALLEQIHEQFEIPITIVSQQDEGVIGFVTAVQAHGALKEPIVSWDIGSGSFQMVTRDATKDSFLTYECQLGTTPSLVALAEKIRGQPLVSGRSLNPVSIEEAIALIGVLQAKMGTPDKSFTETLRDKSMKLVSFGGPDSVFSVCSEISGTKFPMSRENVMVAIKKVAGKKDEAIAMLLHRKENSDLVVAQLCLLYAIMVKLKIRQIDHYYQLSGCTSGVLSWPSLWKV